MFLKIFSSCLQYYRFLCITDVTLTVADKRTRAFGYKITGFSKSTERHSFSVLLSLTNGDNQ